MATEAVKAPAEKAPSYIHYIVVAALCIGFRFLPSFGGLSTEAMGVVGCFIGVIYGWVAIDMLWPSLIAMFGLGMSLGFSDMLAQSFGSTTIGALILCMGVFGIAMTSGAFNWLVNIMLTSKALQGKGWVTLWVILLIAFLMGGNNPIILCVVFCAFENSMFKSCGVQKNDKLIVFMYLGTAFCLMMGQILMPFFSTGLVLLMAYNSMFPNLPLDTIRYLIFMLIMGTLMSAVYILLMKFVFRVDVSPVAGFKNEGERPKCTQTQKVALIMFLIFIIVNIVSALPLGAVSTFLSTYGIIGFSLIFACVIGLFRTKEGTPMTSLEKSLALTNWGQVTMVGVIMIISTAMSNTDLGITAALSKLIMPLMLLPPLVFVVVALLAAVVLTNVANNLIVAVLFMPFLVNFASQIGLAPTGVVCLLFLMAQFALATPAASPVTAVAMSSEMADSIVMTKTALKLVPLLAVIGIAIGWPLSQVLFA